MARNKSQFIPKPVGIPLSPFPQVLNRAYLVFPADWHLSLHQHVDYHELIVVLEGKIRTRIDGQTLVCGPGYALWYPLGAEHEEWSDGDISLRMLFAAWSESPGVTRRAPALTAPDRRGRIELAIRWMLEVPPEPADAAQTRSALMQLVIHEYLEGAPTEQDAMVRRVRNYIREHIAEPITLDDLANAAFMSRYHFVRTFSRATRQTPMNFLRAMRIEAARNLLTTTDLPLRTIAPRVGFPDPFHFSRVYKRITGHAPTFGSRKLPHTEIGP